MVSDEPQGRQQILEGFIGTPEQRAALLADLGLHDRNDWRRPVPKLRPIPKSARGFRIRVDLMDTKPPVWRRIDLPGDITLPRLHDVLQAAMGWQDSHLHRFRTGNDRNPPEFLTQFDLEENDDGMLEDGVRLDQIVAKKGDRLWYAYDFGDGWDHVLRVEDVLDEPPSVPVCVTGKLACPAEDCGGVWSYSEQAAWVRGGYLSAQLPSNFSSVDEGREWLGDWDPDRFDIDEINELLAVVSAEPPMVVAELHTLLDRSAWHGSRVLRQILSRPASAGPTEVGTEAAAQLTEPFRVLLEVIGEGVNLTAAGYLRPADVERVARDTGIADWWIGKVNREDQTRPVWQLRDTARILGLVSVRKGRLAPTVAAKRCAGDPEAVLKHIVARLPIGKSPAERHLGWAALAVASSELPIERWDDNISEIMYGLGWRDAKTQSEPPAAMSPTLDVLRLLAGSAREKRRILSGVKSDVAAAARSVTIKRAEPV